MSITDNLPALRAEWARSRARAARWAEEYELVQEEMRRVIEYLTWDAEQWEGRCTLRKDDSSAMDILSEGLNAYANKQASIRRRLQRQFTTRWHPHLIASGEQPAWLSADSRLDHCMPQQQAPGAGAVTSSTMDSSVTSSIAPLLTAPVFEL